MKPALKVIWLAIAIISTGMLTGCGSSEDASTPQVSSPPPKDPVPGMSETGASEGRTGAEASTLKGPSND